MQKKIELAKSWFVFSQLSMILAGFLFASAGIVITNAQTTMNFGLDKLGEITNVDCDEIENVSNYQEVHIGILDYVGESVSSSINIYRNFFILGIVLTFISVVSFVIGKIKLQKI